MQVDLPMRQRRRLSMTSLIDVVFLLLLFFMLTSTFSHFAQTELTPPVANGGASAQKPAVLAKPQESGWLINGQKITDGDLATIMNTYREKGAIRVLLGVENDLTSQRFVDALEAMRATGLEVAVSGR